VAWAWPVLLDTVGADVVPALEPVELAPLELLLPVDVLAAVTDSVSARLIAATATEPATLAATKQPVMAPIRRRPRSRTGMATPSLSVGGRPGRLPAASRLRRRAFGLLCVG
jgi:hypothetical protein